MAFPPQSLVPGLTRISRETVLGAVYLLFVLLGITYHELWLDELHAWQIVRSSSSLTDLYTNTRYEGHPLLWHLCLWFVQYFTYDPRYMQILHALIATASVCVFIWYSPFRFQEKVLFCLGYFTLFEFALISRNYSLGVLFLFLALASRKYPVRCALALGLMANTYAAAAILAGVLAFVFAFDIWLTRKRLNGKGWAKQYGPAALILGCLFLVALFQYRHPGVQTSVSTPYWPGLPGLIGSVLKTFVPIPSVAAISQQAGVWNSFIVSSDLVQAAGAVLLTVLLTLTLRSNVSRFVFLGMTALIVVFYFLLYQSQSLRHYAILFYTLIALWWVQGGITQAIRPLGRVLAMGVLIIQTACGLLFYGLDLRYSFNRLKEVSEYLHQHNLQHTPVLALYPFVHLSALASYLDRPIYNPDTQSEESFTLLRPNWLREIKQPDLERRILDAQQARKVKESILVTWDQPIQPSDQLKYELLFRTRPSLSGDVIFSIYRCTPASDPQRSP